MKKIYLFVLALSFCSKAFTQQSDFQHTLSSALESFYSNRQLKKIDIVTAQPKYAPGDTVFFTGFLRMLENEKLVKGKQIVNIDLKNKDNVVSLHKRFLFIDGVCSSQFVLLNSFEPGCYNLIAYSDEMIEKNIDPSLFYNSSFMVCGDQEFIRIPQDSEVQFFPEGGRLIEGFNNKVYVESRLVNEQAELITGNDSLIARFVTDANGHATFIVKPNTIGNYYLRIANKKFSLPEIFRDGVFLSLKENTEFITIEIGVTDRSSFKHADLFLTYTIRSEIKYIQKINLQDKKIIDVEILKSQLGQGIGLVTVFASNYEALAQRFFLVHQKQFQFEMSFDKKEYSTKESVNFDISVKDYHGSLVKANLVVSVIQDTLFRNLVSVGLIEQDFKQEGNGDFTSWSNENQNDFLISQKWNWFNWKDVFTTQEKSKYKTVYPYYFKGRLALNTTSNLRLDSTRITFYLQNDDFVYSLSADSEGKFGFPLFKNFEDGEVFYNVYYHDKILKDAKILLEHTDFDFDSPIFEVTKKRDLYGSYANAKKAIMNSYVYYANKTKQDGKFKADDVESDFVVELEKFEPFISMADVLSSVVSMVHYKKNKQDEGVRIFLEKNNYYSTEDPICIIDGIMTNDTEYFLSLDPKKISKIKILRSEEKLRRYGLLGSNGIIALETKVNLSSVVPRNNNSLFVTGITKPISFSNQIQNKFRTPDLRSVLYWNPNVITSKDVQTRLTMNTGDATGKYRIVIKGFTEDGVPLSYKTNFNVTYRP